MSLSDQQNTKGGTRIARLAHRYSLQLLGKVRTIDEDSTNGLLAKLQVTQNKMARFLNGTTILDKVCNKEIYKNSNILSVNQLNCQIKLKEVWKSINDVNYPIQWEVQPKMSGSQDL